MGVLAQNQLKEQLLNSENITMLCDATTKKGRHFYRVKFSTDSNIFTSGFKRSQWQQGRYVCYNYKRHS